MKNVAYKSITLLISHQ